MFGLKSINCVWIVHVIEVSSYGSYTSMNANQYAFDSEKEALEYAEEEAAMFESIHTHIKNKRWKSVRLANDTNCKIVVSRTFDDYTIINEERIFVEKRLSDQCR